MGSRGPCIGSPGRGEPLIRCSGSDRDTAPRCLTKAANSAVPLDHGPVHKYNRCDDDAAEVHPPRTTAKKSVEEQIHTRDRLSDSDCRRP